MPATSLDLSQIKTDALSSASAFRAFIGLGTLATQSATITDYLTIASAVLNFQPLDSDLTSIAALSTTAFGRGLLTEASATTARSTLGLGTLATQSPTGTPSASTFLRGDYSWQTIDLSGYLPLAGGTMTGQLTITQGTANTSVVTSTGYSLTGSNAQSLMDLSGTWNTTGTPTALKLNVTDTASNAASLLMDLQVGGSSRFRVSKAGEARGGNFSVSGTNGFQVFSTGTNRTGLWFDGGGGNVNLLLAANGRFAFGSSTADANTPDTNLVRDAAQTLAQRDGTNPNTFRVYNTFTDSSNYERAKIAWESNVLRIGTEKAGTGSARALELQTDGVTRLTIGSGANHVLTLPDNASIVGGTGTIFRFRYWNSTDNSITFFDCYNTSGFATFSLGATNPRLNFGGTTSSFPAIKRNAAALNFRLADDSADCDITAKAATFSGNVTVSAVNLVTDTTTGTKIGTATTQKLGFYNSTPVVQPAAVADATDAASVITQLNALLSRMRDLGLIAT